VEILQIFANSALIDKVFDKGGDKGSDKGCGCERRWWDDFGRAVSRILSSSKGFEGENHLSQQPVPGTRSAVRNMERAAPWSPIWPCTRWGFPCLRAYAWSGGLLPHLFTLTALFFRKARRFILCGTFRRDASRHRLPRISLSGYAASRPAVFGLSSLPARAERAILRPSKISLIVVLWDLKASCRCHRDLPDGRGHGKPRGNRQFECLNGCAGTSAVAVAEAGHAPSGAARSSGFSCGAPDKPDGD